MGDTKKTSTPSGSNPAKGVNAPSLPTKHTRNDGGKSLTSPSKGGKNEPHRR